MVYNNRKTAPSQKDQKERLLRYIRKTEEDLRAEKWADSMKAYKKDLANEKRLGVLALRRAQKKLDRGDTQGAAYSVKTAVKHCVNVERLRKWIDRAVKIKSGTHYFTKTVGRESIEYPEK